MIYSIFTVTGRDETTGDTIYDAVEHRPTLRQAVGNALDRRATVDIFGEGIKMARVHTDGGVDYTPAAAARRALGK